MLLLQHDFFWSMDPKPLEEEDMPKFEASHELEMKRKRHAERNRGRQEVNPFPSSPQLPPVSELCLSNIEMIFAEVNLIIPTPTMAPSQLHGYTLCIDKQSKRCPNSNGRVVKGSVDQGPVTHMTAPYLKMESILRSATMLLGSGKELAA